MVEECGLLNLASCIPQKIHEFFVGVINAPIQPLLGLEYLDGSNSLGLPFFRLYT